MSEQHTPSSLEGKSFIYNMHLAFSKSGEHIPVENYAHTATNVVLTEHGDWDFDLSGLEGRFSTRYGWSLLLDTPDNRVRIARYQTMQLVIKQMEALCDEARQAMDSLDVITALDAAPADAVSK